MKATIRNIMTPCTIDHINESDVYHMSGLNAGICYMPEDYDTLSKEPLEKTIKRAEQSKLMGHHSVFGHMKVELILENIPKVCAMTLNNLGEFDTSEKSGRYTVMDINDVSKEYYEKWKDIFDRLLRDVFPNMTPRMLKTLSLENARYMLSVFTPTTMGYTTSIRQWQYIIDWCYELAEMNFENTFYKQWQKEMLNLAKTIEPLVRIEEFHDNKSRTFNLFRPNEAESINVKDYFSYSYQTLYKGSFSYLAQAQRHRTIDYVAYFSGSPRNFYVPKILAKQKFDLVEEWLEDLNTLSDKYQIVPQATQLYILERGTIENFILKTKERACSEAQLEIQKLTHHIHELYEKSENLTPQLRDYLNTYSKKVRCAYPDFQCKKPCPYGVKSIDRII